MVATAIAIPPVILARKRLWQASYVPPDTHRRFAFPHPRLKDKLAFSAPGGEVLADRADDGRMMIPAIISTIQRDRVGDEVVPEGCRLDAYRRNPVVFFAHQDLPIPVGLAETPNGELAVRIVAGKHVEADCYFHQSSKEGPQFYVLVRDGIIRSTSIGFNPTEEPEKLGEIEGNLYAGYRFTGWELLEFSWVGVPANPYCGRVRQLLSAGKIAGEPISPMLRKSLEPLSEAAPIWEPSGFVQTVKSGDGREAEAQRAAFEQQFEHHAAHHPPARSILPGRHADRVLNGRLSLHLQRSAPETIRWNRSLSKAFDVEVMPSRACTAEYDWVSKHIGCKVKHLYQNGTGVPSARMGSFLTGLKHVLSEHKLNDVRNLTYDGTERPPRYEVVQLNSEKRDDFLVDGLAFYTAAHCKFALAVSPTWGGLILTVYTDQKDKGFNQQVLDRAWAWAKTNNFLKGEAFALSGEFLNRTSESWDDVFLEEE
ncbi:MAG TPA: hypothetical protein VNN25_21845, partial [Thermoanaerobaculia bacterium]|nr:hypothetical protein [Thermoanaerobaculia bacterium]